MKPNAKRIEKQISWLTSFPRMLWLSRFVGKREECESARPIPRAVCYNLFTEQGQTAPVVLRAALSAASRRKVLQQFLRSLIEPLLVFLLFFAGFNRMLGSTYPNELLHSGVIHTNDESPDVIA